MALMHLYSEQQLEEALADGEEHIEHPTRRKAIGIRGPGFRVSQTTLRGLAQRGCLYDCSTFSTYLGRLARAYYFRVKSQSSHRDLRLLSEAVS